MKKITIGLALVWVLTWAVSAVIKPSANTEARISGFSPEVQRILDRSCADCHSPHTKWPWYGNLPFANLLMSIHVRKGRSELDFSKWDELRDRKRNKMSEEIIEEIEEGEMPPKIYLWLHSDAKLSKQDFDALKKEFLTH